MRRRRSLDGGAGLVERADLEDLEPVGHVPDDLVAVVGGGEEELRAVGARPGELLPDAADRARPALLVDRAGAGDLVVAGERAGRQLVVDAEREHQPGGRAADRAPRRSVTLRREVVGEAEDDAERGAAPPARRRSARRR